MRFGVACFAPQILIFVSLLQYVIAGRDALAPHDHKKPFAFFYLDFLDAEHPTAKSIVPLLVVISLVPLRTDKA